MFAVIFEVQPKQGRFDGYIDLAQRLRPALEKTDGFIEIERFGSKRTKDRLLSLSIWRDEKALIRWRTFGAHHGAQERGRRELFDDYHLRVGEIVADSGRSQPSQLIEQRFDETEVGQAKIVTVSELAPMGRGEGNFTDPISDFGLPKTELAGVIDRELFESITNPGKLLLLVGWTNAMAAERWSPAVAGGREPRHRRIRIIRDYGLHDRREAPQYYPDVPDVRAAEAKAPSAPPAVG